MKPVKTLLFLLLIVSHLIICCGCWNYRDIEEVYMVAGIAIDKNEQGDKYLLTTEYISYQASGKEAKQSSEFIETEGNTLFDAVRNVINKAGKRLYWAHASIVIVNQYIAKEGVAQILDFIMRDAEMREEMYILISKEKTAAEVLKQSGLQGQSSSDKIHDMVYNQKAVADSPIVHAYELIDKLEDEGISAVLPAIRLIESESKKTPEIAGTAVFKSDKLVGFLNNVETKYFLFATNQIKGGLITLKENPSDLVDDITLEIYKNKTKVKPIHADNKPTIKISIKTDVAIGELAIDKNYIGQKKLQEKLKKDAEDKVKLSVEDLIRKVQSEYDSDIFGFGKKIKADEPDQWRIYKKTKEDYFKKLNFDIKVDIAIKNSALSMKPVQKGD